MPDQTGLNQVMIKCCDVPEIQDSCTPIDRWEEGSERLVNNGDLANTLSVSFSTGISHRERNTQTDVEANSIKKYSSLKGELGLKVPYVEDLKKKKDTVSKKLLHNTRTFLSKLKGSVNWGTEKSKTTGYDWSKTIVDDMLWSDQTTNTFSMTVPPHSVGFLYQVVGYCGHISIKTNYVRPVTRKLIPEDNIQINKNS